MSIVSGISFLTSFALREIEGLISRRRAVTGLTWEKETVERYCLSLEDERGWNSLSGGHIRDDNGRFRILSEGDWKSLLELP